ncbi:Growth/differentiation factor 8 [Anthophora plagiata]
MVRGALLLLLLVLYGAFDAPGIGRTRLRYLVEAGNTCNACRMHEEIRALSLEAIKEQILNKLGLKQAPNMTGRALPRIPPISKLMDMYGMQADQPQPLEPGITHHEEIDEYAAKTESVFALAQPHQRLRHSKGSLDVLYFKFSDKVVQHRVTRAELSIWIWGSNQAVSELDEAGDFDGTESHEEEGGGTGDDHVAEDSSWWYRNWGTVVGPSFDHETSSTGWLQR